MINVYPNISFKKYFLKLKKEGYIYEM